MKPVDVADCETWPVAVRVQVDTWARSLERTTTYTSDLAVPLEAERPFLDLLQGHLLVAHHFTRLLDSERVQVKREGLQALTGELIERRIQGAVGTGEISDASAQILRSQHFFAQPSDGGTRAGQVCFVLSDHILRYDPEALGNLLTLWGGEGMYMLANDRARVLVRGLGVPSVVTAFLDVSAMNSRHRFSPSLPRVFVGTALGLNDAHGDAFYRGNVPPDNIHRIAQPGHPWYDAYETLPRS